MIASPPRHKTKLKILATAVTTSLATASIANDLMASLALADDIVMGNPGNVDLYRYSAESKIVVVQGYSKIESQDEDADRILFQGAYLALRFKIISLIIVANDLPSAERKASVYKKAADKYVLSRFPESGVGRLHVVHEPISNAEAVSLSRDAEILLTIY